MYFIGVRVNKMLHFNLLALESPVLQSCPLPEPLLRLIETSQTPTLMAGKIYTSATAKRVVFI